jgi:hypothetical protein
MGESEMMERILELEARLKPHDVAVDLMASLRLHGSDAYLAIEEAAFAIWCELDDLRGRLATMLLLLQRLTTPTTTEQSAVRQRSWRPIAFQEA